MPKQTALIGGVVAVLVVVAIGGYLVMNKKSAQTPQGEVTTQEQKSEGLGIVKGSIKSLLSGGKNVACSVKYPTEEIASEGKVYVSANKMRGDFTTTIEGKMMESHMISDGTYMYSWATGTPQGIKMKIDEAQASASPVVGQPEKVDIDQEVDMDCSSWGVDDSKFTPPTDVKFMDLSSILKPTSSPASQGTGQNQGSSVCDQITDPQAKAACQGAGY